MSKIEVDETAFLSSQQTVKAVEAMLADPKARKLVLQAQKIINPNAAIPEIDAAAPLNAEMQAMRDEHAAMKAEIAADKATREQQERTAAFAKSWESQKNTLRRAGWTDEGITGVETLAQERGIADLDVAAAYFEKLHPPAEPIQPSGLMGFDMTAPDDREGADMKKLIESEGNDEMSLRGLINQGLAEARGTPVKR